jgi:excisionase family DNA binding protein
MTEDRAQVTTQTAMAMASSPGTSGIMTIGEVGDYLKGTERTIYRLADANKMPPFKVGGILTTGYRCVDQAAVAHHGDLPVMDSDEQIAIQPPIYVLLGHVPQALLTI